MMHFIRVSYFKPLAFLFIFLCFSTNVYAQTTSDMAAEAGQLKFSAEEEMQKIIEDISYFYKDDPLFLEKFEKSQVAWDAFRDAQMDMKYPHPEGESHTHYYGSSYRFCSPAALEGLVRQRIEQLRVWIDGIPGGMFVLARFDFHKA